MPKPGIPQAPCYAKRSLNALRSSRPGMRGLRSIIGALALLLAPIAACAQGTIQQTGAVTQFHLPYWSGNGVVSDAGTSSVPFVNAFGMFNGANCPFGISSQTGPGVTTAPFSLFSICQTNGTTTFYFTGQNGQANPNVVFNVGGVNYNFPFGGGGGGVASLNGLSGILNLVAGSGITVTPSGTNITLTASGSGSGSVTSVATDSTLTGGPITTTGTLSRAALSGDVTASGGSNVTTLATVNGSPGTYGSTTSIPTVTVDGKGRTTTGSSTTLTAAIDAAFGNAQGDILYRGASGWTVLAPGSSGQLLKTNGAGANPSWIAGGGSGTVTSVATDSTLTGGPITASGTLSRAALTGDVTASGGSNTTVLATVNASPGTYGSTTSIPSVTVNAKGLTTAASSTTLTAALDAAFGSAQGDILYRGASAWTVLTPGTSGNFLQTAGAAANPTWASAAASVGALTNVTALRALTSATTPIPQTLAGYTTAGDGGGGWFTYVASDTTTADNSCTVFVDADSRRWYRVVPVGPVHVKWCGAKGDGSTDDTTAIRAALSVGQAVFVDSSPNCYVLSNSLTIAPYQTLEGDSEFSSCLQANTASTPIIIDQTHNDTTNNSIVVRNLKLDRSTPATAGGDGIHFGSYATSVLFDHLYVQNQYEGISVTSTDDSNINNSIVTENYDNGLLMTSSSWYPTIQWSMKDVFATSNEANGFKATGTSAAGCGSMGTWTNLRTFGNPVHGVYVTAPDSSDCLQGFRLTGGFFGQDGNDEIYIDNYNTGAGQNVVEPSYVELAGTQATGRTNGHAQSNVGSGIYLSANAGPTEVKCGVCNQNSYDGLTSFATFTNVTGGNYTNNGMGSGSGRHNGIFIAGGNANGVLITGVTAGNTAGSTQLYGIASSVDYVSTTGVNLLNNATAYGTGLAGTHSVVSGALPIAANTTCATTCTLASLTVTGQTQTQDLYVTRSIGLAATPDGTTAHFAGPGGGIAFSGGLNVNVTGALAVTGATTLTGGASMGSDIGMGGHNISNAGAVTATGQIQSQDLYVTRSIGFTTTPDGVTGHFAGTPIAFTGTSINMTGALAVTGASTLTGGASMGSDIGMGGHNISGGGTAGFSGAVTVGSLASGAITGTTISASTDIATTGSATTHLVGSGGIALAGGITVTSGGMNFTATGTNSINAVDNIQVRTSMGVGSTGALDGVDGHVKIGVAVVVGAATGSYIGAGTINVSGSLSLNGTAYTNP